MQKGNTRQIKFLTQNELQKFFLQIEKMKNDNQFYLRDLAMFNISYYCGLRAGEIGGIRLNDYSQDIGELKLQRLKGSLNNTIRLDRKRKQIFDKYLKQYIKFKGASQRLYHINNDYDYIFKTKFGLPMNTKSFEIIFKKYMIKTNIQTSKHHPHVLKHSIAVHLAESGADIKDIKNWLGHKNVNNTEIYFQYTSFQQDQLYRKLERFNRIV